MVDPHVRVLKDFIPYEPGAYQGVPDCFIRPSEKTACLDIPAHFHLRYLKRLNRRNAALRFLPRDVHQFENSEFVRPYRFPIPADLQGLVASYLA